MDTEKGEQTGMQPAQLSNSEIAMRFGSERRIVTRNLLKSNPELVPAYTELKFEEKVVEAEEEELLGSEELEPKKRRGRKPKKRKYPVEGVRAHRESHKRPKDLSTGDLTCIPINTLPKIVNRIRSVLPEETKVSSLSPNPFLPC